MKKKTAEPTVDVIDLRMDQLRFRIVGTSPLIMHRMSQKAMQELLYPKIKNKADRITTEKHNPLEEFRGSIYKTRAGQGATAIHLPNNCFAKAVAQAALDIPGVSKAQIARLTSIKGGIVDLYGVPQLYTTVVRNSGINRTPDVRTRAIFPQWACELTITCVSNIVRPAAVEKLLAAAGEIVGIGDWRPEKGGPNGKWRLCETASDKEYEAIAKKQGSAAQLKAINAPDYYDEETREIIEWFLEERETRTVVKAERAPARKRSNGHVEAAP